MEYIQKLYQEALTKDSLRLEIPKECLGDCSFNTNSDLSWEEQKEFAKFYNLDLLVAKVTRWAKKLEGTPILALDHSAIISQKGIVAEKGKQLDSHFSGTLLSWNFQAKKEDKL